MIQLDDNRLLAAVLEAISEIRPPLITATLAVIVSFLPMFGITGSMGGPPVEPKPIRQHCHEH